MERECIGRTAEGMAKLIHSMSIEPQYAQMREDMTDYGSDAELRMAHTLIEAGFFKPCGRHPGNYLVNRKRLEVWAKRIRGPADEVLRSRVR